MRLGRYEMAKGLSGQGLTYAWPSNKAAFFNHNTLGSIAERTGAFVEARGHFENALAVAETLTVPVLKADILTNIVQLDIALGDYPQAEKRVKTALDFYRQAGYPTGTVVGTQLQGELARVTGRLEEAKALFEKGLALARELGFQQRIPGPLLGLAEAELARGEAEAAAELAEHARVMNPTEDDRSSEEIVALNILGYAGAMTGENRAWHAHFERGLRAAWNVRDVVRLAVGFVYLAEVQAKLGLFRQSATLLTVAARHPSATYHLKARAQAQLDSLWPHLSAAERADVQEGGEGFESAVEEALGWLASVRAASIVSESGGP
jgi:tetratricopeptide (TPR) repeat protein